MQFHANCKCDCVYMWGGSVMGVYLHVYTDVAHVCFVGLFSHLTVCCTPALFLEVRGYREQLSRSPP